MNYAYRVSRIKFNAVHKIVNKQQDFSKITILATKRTLLDISLT